jgi:prolyl-tRNA editing enzyme YbaK/EbsC (Cys-tRNA(Pro) deacylase)
MLTPNDLQIFMNHNKIPGEIIILEVPTPTVEAAAHALGTEPEHIVKSVLFKVSDSQVLAITCGTRHIEQQVIAVRFGVGRKRVRLASSEIVLSVTGYPVGTVPPFGHQSFLKSLIDPSVLALSEVYAGGGAHNAMLRLNPSDILRCTQAEIIDLHVHS